MSSESLIFALVKWEMTNFCAVERDLHAYIYTCLAFSLPLIILRQTRDPVNGAISPVGITSHL
jgi:hypothetical protein